MIVLKKNFVFCILFGLLSFSGAVNATDLNIATFQNITENCDYNSGTRTYNCSVDSNGEVWDNINISSSISLPTSWVYSTNIIFKAENDFISKSISALGSGSDKDPGHDGGSIKIDAGNIIIDGSLYNYGTYCRSYNCYSGYYATPCGNGGRGGYVELISGNDVLLTGNINSYGGSATHCNGGGTGGRGGSVHIISNNIFNITDINIHGLPGAGGGSGGTIVVSSPEIRIKTVNAYGGYGSYYGGGSGGVLVFDSEITVIDGNLGFYGDYGDYPGGSGGSISIDTGTLSLNGVVNVYGSYGRDRYAPGGAGGTLNIFAKTINNIGVISVSAGSSARGASGRPGGTVKIITENDLVLPSIIAVGSSGGSGDGDNSYYASGHGGAGGSVLVVAPRLTISGPINANAGSGGTGDEIRGGNGGSAKQIIIYSDEIDYSGALISAKGGNGGWERTWIADWYQTGSGGNGGNVYIFTDDSLIIGNYNIDVSKGTSLHSSPGAEGNKAIGDRTVPIGFRLTSTIKELSTNNLFTGSTQIRIIDPESGIHVPITKTYNAWFGETDIDNGQVNSLFGDKPLMIMLAKKYYLEITTSDDLFFSKANCDLGVANCDTHFVEFRQYYE